MHTPVEPAINTCHVFGWVKDANNAAVANGLVVLSHADFPHGEQLISGKRINRRTDDAGFFDFGQIIETESISLAPYDFVVDGRRYTGIQIPNQADCPFGELIPLAQVTETLTASALAVLGELEAGRVLSRIAVFAFGTASPVVIEAALKAGDIIDDTAIQIGTAFDGTAPTLEVGTPADPDAFLAAADNDPKTVGTYRSRAPVDVAADTSLQLTITPDGATVGAGRVLVSIRR